MERIKEVQVTLRPYVEASKRVEGRNIKDIKFYSRDTNSSYIRFIFEKNDGCPLLLDDSYKVTVRLRFSSDDSTHTAYPSIEEDGTALYYFDTNLITKFENVKVFVYLEKEDKMADVYSFTIKVDLSEADKESGGKRVPIAGGIDELLNATHKHVVDIGDGIALEHTITHNLNTSGVIVQIRETISPYTQVIADVEIVDENSILIRTSRPISAEEKLNVTVIG